MYAKTIVWSSSICMHLLILTSSMVLCCYTISYIVVASRSKSLDFIYSRYKTDEIITAFWVKKTFSIRKYVWFVNWWCWPAIVFVWLHSIMDCAITPNAPATQCGKWCNCCACQCDDSFYYIKAVNHFVKSYFCFRCKQTCAFGIEVLVDLEKCEAFLIKALETRLNGIQ